MVQFIIALCLNEHKNSIEFNQKYSDKWPNITVKKDALPDAEKYATEEGKMKYFKEGETND